MPRGIPAKPKKCPICGDEFVPEKPSQRYCGKDHYQPCPVCGKPVLWNSMREVPVCSKECKRKRTRQRNLEKYGVEHPMSLKSVQEKHKASMKAHYGVEHALQSDEIKKKAIETNREKFGCDWALGNSEVHDKVKKTMTERYGAPTTSSPCTPTRPTVGSDSTPASCVPTRSLACRRWIAICWPAPAVWWSVWRSR